MEATSNSDMNTLPHSVNVVYRCNSTLDCSYQRVTEEGAHMSEYRLSVMGDRPYKLAVGSALQTH